jgi:hypothetical protein
MLCDLGIKDGSNFGRKVHKRVVFSTSRHHKMNQLVTCQTSIGCQIEIIITKSWRRRLLEMFIEQKK